MNKPNLFIVGAPKCGTTFLYELLEGREDFFLPSIKELNYFSHEELLESSYYRDYKVQSLPKYLKHFKGSREQHQYLVDSSVSYFISEQAPVKIEEFNSDARIIIMLRDPVARAYSHYLMDKRMGYATESLEKYLEDTTSFHYQHYIGNSSYHRHVNRYFEMFGMDNVLVLKLENLDQVPEKLGLFLGLDLSFDGDELKKVVNPKKSAKNIVGRFALKNRHIVERVKQVIPISIKQAILKRIYGEAKVERLTDVQRSMLADILRDDIEYFNRLDQ